MQRVSFIMPSDKARPDPTGDPAAFSCVISTKDATLAGECGNFVRPQRLPVWSLSWGRAATGTPSGSHACNQIADDYSRFRAIVRPSSPGGPGLAASLR
jgi:hypothetical protein